MTSIEEPGWARSARRSSSASWTRSRRNPRLTRINYLTAETIDMLAGDGADAGLVGLLREALAGREGMDVRWVRE